MSDFLIQRIRSARSTSVSEVPTRQHGDDLLAVGSEHHGDVGPHDPRAPTENVPKESDPLPASAETMRASYTVEAAGFAVVCLPRARSCRSALMAARGGLMHRRIKQLQRLAPWEQWMLLKLLVLLPAIGAALRLLDFHATFGLIARSVPEAEARAGCGEECPGEDIAHRIGRLVSIAANHGPYRATCLRQSLALWWLLRRRRIPAELRIGVRKDSAGLRAHAWVELDGRALNDPSGVCRTYAPFPRSSAVGALPLP